MRFIESVDITSREQSPKTILCNLRELGYEVKEFEYGTSIRVQYQRMANNDEKLNAVKSTVLRLIPSAEFRRMITPKFDDDDIAIAELYDILAKKDLRAMPSPPKPLVCVECGKSAGNYEFDETFRVRKIRSKGSLFFLENYWSPVVSLHTREQIEAANLKGYRFAPLDEDERYFHLIATSSLGYPVLRAEEFLGLDGICSLCGLPRFDMSFGPARFRRADWNGSDVVIGHFIGRRTFFSKRAIDVFRRCDRKFGVLEPVFLD